MPVINRTSFKLLWKSFKSQWNDGPNDPNIPASLIFRTTPRQCCCLRTKYPRRRAAFGRRFYITLDIGSSEPRLTHGSLLLMAGTIPCSCTVELCSTTHQSKQNHLLVSCRRGCLPLAINHALLLFVYVIRFDFVLPKWSEHCAWDQQLC